MLSSEGFFVLVVVMIIGLICTAVDSSKKSNFYLGMLEEDLYKAIGKPANVQDHGTYKVLLYKKWYSFQYYLVIIITNNQVTHISKYD